jgi:hypothetical protein
MPIAKEQIRQIISENNITSVADVYSLLRDSFKDILQELMEAEMDATLGYEKNRRGISSPTTRETDILPKPLKASTVNSRLISPVTETGCLSRSWFPNTRGIFPA